MIDREKVIKELENYEPYARAFSNITIIGSIVIDTLELLKEQEDVVRCKDCKHYKDETGMCDFCHTHGNAETWFCADGERMVKMK